MVVDFEVRQHQTTAGLVQAEGLLESEPVPIKLPRRGDIVRLQPDVRNPYNRRSGGAVACDQRQGGGYGQSKADLHSKRSYSSRAAGGAKAAVIPEVSG